MTYRIELAVFGAGMVAALANSVGILASAAGRSDFYPPGEKNSSYVAFWALSHAVSGAILALALLQWQRVAVPVPFAVLGFGLAALGSAIALGAGLDLGMERSSGLAGDLRTDGWYQYSRNPQYVGYVLATVGFPLATGAPLVVPLAAIYLGWWLAFPLAEERWLEERHGEAYRRYAERVPRFVGRRTLAALLGDERNGDSPESP